MMWPRPPRPRARLVARLASGCRHGGLGFLLGFALAAASAQETNVTRGATSGTPNVATNLAANVTTNEPPSMDYAAFRLVNDRNIFNQNRAPGRRGGGPAARAAQVDTFSLVGTMNYGKGWFAFFEGSSRDYRKTIRPSESIAGYKVTEIGQSRVKLSGGTNTVELPVGGQMRREDEGEWVLTAQAPLPLLEPPASPGTTTTSATSSGTAGTTASAGDDEALKRLLQRREQELNK